METKKIAVACFIGGAVCCAVALMFAPVYWWLGLIAGMAGGYISYEFREFREAVPVAFRAARKCSESAWNNMIAVARKWLSQSHPFFYPAAIVTAPFYVWFVYLIAPYLVGELASLGMVVGLILGVVMSATLILGFIEATWVVIAPFVILAFIGARVGEQCYWWPFFTNKGEKQAEEDVAWLEENGIRRMPMSYSNVLRWTVKGFGLTVLFFVWTIWKDFAIGVWKMLCFFGRFAWNLFKFVHSEKRVLCAIDGTLGGAVIYIWLASSTMAFVEQMILVVFGGLIGAALGVANWEIVSKGLLHVTASTS